MYLTQRFMWSKVLEMSGVLILILNPTLLMDSYKNVKNSSITRLNIRFTRHDGPLLSV